MSVSVVPPMLPTPQPTLDEGMHYRPEKDLAAFKSLLPPEIEFMEGSSTGALAVPPGKYDPINGSPKTAQPDLPRPPTPQSKSTPTVPSPQSKLTSVPSPSSLYSKTLDFSWPDGCKLGSGLYNSGNSCFLNSALQCLLHTPPLLRILYAHNQTSCNAKGFCMICGLRTVAHKVHTSRSAVSPSPIGEKLQVIAKHMRRGRQEDSHEFLRYAIDALQKSCLAGHPQKIDPKLAETTWVHKLFGGRLRSRVSCRSCGHNSDTFDRVLDLSLDIYNVDSLKKALRKFIAPDLLKGSDKYKCENCKKHVDAEKRFSVHEAPVVLTIHLKRFSPLGRKIGHEVDYEEHLTLNPYMSEGQYGPTYSLYGVVCHAGGGPNSGHYYAFVKSKDGTWHEMNDESVSRSTGKSRKNAYMLFYIQTKGQKLDSAIHFTPSSITSSSKKRKTSDMEEDEDQGTKLSPPSPQPFIGPIKPPTPPPSDAKRTKLNGADPQADAVKKKIDGVKRSIPAPSSSSLAPLADYGSDSDNTDKENIATTLAQSSPTVNAKDDSSPSRPPPPPSSTPASSSPDRPTASPTNFYGTPGAANAKKRLTNGSLWRDRSTGFSPYSAGRFKNTYGKKHRRGI